MSENLNKLKAILREMFQLDQADLDFGIYRIMNQKRDEIEQFLDRDLLPQVKTAFSHFQGDDQGSIREEMEKLKKTLEDAGVVAEDTPKYKALQAKLSQSVDVAVLENEVFSQLTNFFRRYYQSGDFLSLRRYKAGVYAIPYEGEEVKLHWANADQYYIKSTENFRDYTFKLPSGKRAHFKLVEASTEQNNKKEQAGKERRFILVEETPLVVDNGELYIRFEYRVADENSKQTALNEAAVQTIFASLPHPHPNPPLEGEGALKSSFLPFQGGGQEGDGVDCAVDWKRELSALAPTEKNPRRTLLEKHLNDYTAKYSFDYFIHKDLGGFMRRELDFYIKNEVLFVDDLDADHVKASISKVKVIKEIGHKVIAFLEQLENFQKKLWLKKKFVVETGYCVTLDKVPVELYPAIIANTAQVEEWKRLFAIQDIEGGLLIPKYTDPLTMEFLKANPFLVLDTVFFDCEFKENLLSSFDNLDEITGGVLVNGDNFQALNLMQMRHGGQVNCVYIDPPYNTDASAIAYKNDYKDSSWLSLMQDRLFLAKSLMRSDALICVAIDDEEVSPLRFVLSDLFEKQIGVGVVRSNPQSRKTKGKFSPVHEYALFYGKTEKSLPASIGYSANKAARYPLVDEKGRYSWMNFIRAGNNDLREDRPKLFYPIAVNNNDIIRVPKMEWDETRQEYRLLEEIKPEEVLVYPIKVSDGNSVEKNWQRGNIRVASEYEEYRVRRNVNGEISIDFKTRMDEEALPVTWWDKNEYASANYGASELKNLFSEKPFDFPKAGKLVEDALLACGAGEENTTVLDYFGGSGTTGHALININREDKGNRKYILVEVGNHFDTVLKPRIHKVIYSKDWKDGKPVSRQGSSHLFKYIRLESYEDALNNLQLQRTPEQGSLLDQHDKLREQYMLSYMLDVESAGSSSLLNISAFADPFGYRMNIARGNETKETVVDLVETFNWLLGIKVMRISQKEYRTAEFERDGEGRLQIVKGSMRKANPPQPPFQKGGSLTSPPLQKGDLGGFAFQEVEGQTLAGDKVLIIWRTLTDNPEKDNLLLDSWFSKRNYSTLDFEFARIYVNGDNNLENLKIGEERWKVALIEAEFKKLMFDVEGV
jgi:adenine-specific DNA-methyltransferase